MTASYVATFLAMVIGNVVFEGGITPYLTVQTLGLLGVVAFTTFPMWAHRPHARGEADIQVVQRETCATALKRVGLSFVTRQDAAADLRPPRFLGGAETRPPSARMRWG